MVIQLFKGWNKSFWFLKTILWKADYIEDHFFKRSLSSCGEILYSFLNALEK